MRKNLKIFQQTFCYLVSSLLAGCHQVLLHFLALSQRCWSLWIYSIIIALSFSTHSVKSIHHFFSYGLFPVSHLSFDVKTLLFFFTCCNECLRGNNDYHLSYVHLSLFSCLFFISFVETCWKCAPPSTLLFPFLQSDFLLLISLVVLAALLQQFSLLSPLHLEEIMFPDKEEWGCNSLQVDLGTSRFILILIILFGNRDQTGKQGGK